MLLLTAAILWLQYGTAAFFEMIRVRLGRVFLKQGFG
jgi:hypothetical protein